jgi:predicted secreted protein
MEWYTGLALLVIIILTVILGALLACKFAGQNCTISIQQRTPNHELTKVQQEEERRKRKKFSSRFKRAFQSKAQQDTPNQPVEDVKTVELTFKLGERSKQEQEMVPMDERAVALLSKSHITEAELEERRKHREAIRKKYNL